MNSVKKVKTRKGEVNLITLQNKDIEVTFLDLGATIYDIKTKDQHGTFESVVMKYKDLEAYFTNEISLNATIGPIAGRTKDGKFTLNNKQYQLDLNFKDNTNLHSGKDALALQFFDFKQTDNQVIFTHNKNYKSQFPGNQIFTVTYTITNSDIHIKYDVTTDQDTLVNLTNHAYFNLSGDLKDTILNHRLQLNSLTNLTVDENFVPYAKNNIEGTFLDFYQEKYIKDNFFDGIYDLPELGIDHQMEVKDKGIKYRQAYLYDEQSKRTLEVYTSYPIIVVYTHNHTSDDLLQNNKHEKHYGICFEAQYESNGINVKEFHDSILRKEDQYQEEILFRFGLKE